MIAPNNLLAAMDPFRLKEPGEGWQNDPDKRTYLVSEEMLAYLTLSLDKHPKAPEHFEYNPTVAFQPGAPLTVEVQQQGVRQLEQV